MHVCVSGGGTRISELVTFKHKHSPGYIYIDYVYIFASMFISISGASLVAQMGKKLPAMQETGVQSLSWEDPLEKGIATHSSILA